MKVLDADDIRFLKTYGLGPYSASIKKVEQDLKDIQKRVIDTIGIKESDTGLAPPSRWDLVADKQMLHEEHPLQVRSRVCAELCQRLTLPCKALQRCFSVVMLPAFVAKHLQCVVDMSAPCVV